MALAQACLFRAVVLPFLRTACLDPGTTKNDEGRLFPFVNTLRHWEQGNREPEGPARAYLLVIARAPDAVQKALGITERRKTKPLPKTAA
jgi:hypothetical protein